MASRCFFCATCLKEADEPLSLYICKGTGNAVIVCGRCDRDGDTDHRIHVQVQKDTIFFYVAVAVVLACTGIIAMLYT